jgi:hypothetical protein
VHNNNNNKVIIIIIVHGDVFAHLLCIFYRNSSIENVYRPLLFMPKRLIIKAWLRRFVGRMQDLPSCHNEMYVKESVNRKTLWTQTELSKLESSDLVHILIMQRGHSLLFKIRVVILFCRQDTN